MHVSSIYFSFFDAMKAHPHYEGYFLTEDGRVYSTRHRWGPIQPRELKAQTDSDGYLHLRVYYGSRSQKKDVSVHRLVAQTFIENPDNLPEVNHINGVKHDNRVSNLEWVNRSQQITHSHRINSKYLYTVQIQATGETFETASLSSCARAFGIKRGELLRQYYSQPKRTKHPLRVLSRRLIENPSD